MPLPGPPPEPFFEPQKIVWQSKAPAPKSSGEEKILIAANQVGEQHEVALSGRHYKFILPKGWAVYDDSQTPDQRMGALPTVEVQFVAPQRPGGSVGFSYRGRPLHSETGAVFAETLKDPKMAQAVPPKQIDRLTSIFGSFVSENQYLSNHPPGVMPRFKMTSCKTVTLANGKPALSVEGEWRNDPDPKSKPDEYQHVIYLDQDGDGTQVHKIELSSSDKQSFDSLQFVFDRMLKSLTW